MSLEKSYEYNVDIHQLYNDYKQAYDSINGDPLVEIMKKFGIPSKLIRQVKMPLKKTSNKIKIQGKVSPSFETVVGLRQGGALSTLTNLCMKKLIRNVKTNPGKTIFNRTWQCLLYADDVVVLGCTVKHTAETVEDMTSVISQIGLTIKALKKNI
jgi:hypothetical protein